MMRLLAKLLISLMVASLLTAVAAATHPIYVVLTHPRATATAFEQIFRSRGDMVVLHAPFLPTYLVDKYGPDHPLTRPLGEVHRSFDDVRADLLARADLAPLFFKESGYLLIEDIHAHPEFYLSEQVKLCILVRDPARSILSYYNKMPNVTASILGYRQLWELFTWIEQQQGTAPLVIDSDRLLKAPLAILNLLGEQWGLSFHEENLSWESGYAPDWHQREWYREVASSTGLGPFLGDVPREEDHTPAYREVGDPDDRARLQQFFRQMLPFYERLRVHAL